MSLYRGIANTCFLVLSASYLSVVLLSPLCYLLILPQTRRAFRPIADSLMATWLSMAVCLQELVLGTKLIITGDCLRVEPSLLFCNHRTELDWLYLWSLFSRGDALGTLKIFLKASLMHVPGFGWGAQCCQYIFLQRKFETDQPVIDSKCALFRNTYDSRERPARLLIFPEGTSMSERSIAASHRFAETCSLPKLKHVLLPRTTGFTYTLEQLEGYVEAVYDITIAYSNNADMLEKGKNFVLGHWPHCVFVHVQRHSINKLPSSSHERAQWINARWREKEKLLDEFEASSKQRLSSTEPHHHTQTQLIKLWAALLFMVSVVLVSFYYTLKYPWFRWTCLSSALQFAALSACWGADRFELKMSSGDIASARSQNSPQPVAELTCLPFSPKSEGRFSGAMDTKGLVTSILESPLQQKINSYNHKPSEAIANSVVIGYFALVFVMCHFNS